jgi:hypothetical protein
VPGIGEVTVFMIRSDAYAIAVRRDGRTWTSEPVVLDFVDHACANGACHHLDVDVKRSPATHPGRVSVIEVASSEVITSNTDKVLQIVWAKHTAFAIVRAGDGARYYVRRIDERPGCELKVADDVLTETCKLAPTQ